MKELKVISLFSGYGTQELALKYSGINHTTVAHCDILPSANTAFNSLHKTELGNLGDVSKVDEKKLPACDLLTYSFPCFTKNTLVLTDNGYKSIDNIEVGDKVLTHTNTYKNVLNTFDQGKKEIWKIISSSVDSIETTENHKFYVRSKNNKEKFDLTEPYWKECKDLTKDDYLGIAINQNSIIPTYDNVELSNLMDNKDFWWVIGRYMGDSWTKSDLELNDIKNKFSLLNLKYNISQEDSFYKIHLPEIDKIVDELNKTIIHLPKYLLESFINGYGIQNNKLSSASRELIYSIGQCIAKLYNIPYSIYKTDNGTYILTYDFKDPNNKQAFYDNGYIWNPIRSVENTFTQDNVYDIEVDEDHSFTANGCIAHNCQDISISGIQRGIKKGTRSGLLYEVERLVEHNKPKYLLMENVKNLVSKNHMPAFNEYIEKLESLGYGNSWIVLNGADFGCPQNRERVFMFSVLGETTENVNKIMAGVHNHKKERIPMRTFIENVDEKSLFITPPYELNTPKVASVCRLVARRTDIKYDQTRRIYGLDGCSPCLTTSGSPQIMLDDKQIRTLTAREGYRFMGVKDADIDLLLTTSLSTNQHIALAGNSICVPVMQAIFNEFLGEYKNEYKVESAELEDDEDFFNI